MVGPSLSDDERRLANTRLKVGFVLLVGLSGGLVALQAGATTLQVGAAVAGGFLLGGALLVFLVRTGRQFRESGGRRSHRRR